MLTALERRGGKLKLHKRLSGEQKLGLEPREAPPLAGSISRALRIILVLLACIHDRGVE